MTKKKRSSLHSLAICLKCHQYFASCIQKLLKSEQSLWTSKHDFADVGFCFANSDLGFVGSFVDNDLDYHDLKVKIIEMYILIICRRYHL